MDSQRREELKPCPFCGRYPEMIRLDKPFVEIWQIRCKCGCNPIQATGENAQKECLKFWNARPQVEPTAPDIKAISKWLYGHGTEDMTESYCDVLADELVKEFSTTCILTKPAGKISVEPIIKAIDAIVADRYESTVAEAYKNTIDELVKLKDYLKA